uniref:hypothetical protein n=1 Tax=Serratia surfactantfaciens TaxID=2741499 RepID=UPI001B3C9A89
MKINKERLFEISVAIGQVVLDLALSGEDISRGKIIFRINDFILLTKDLSRKGVLIDAKHFILNGTHSQVEYIDNKG